MDKIKLKSGREVELNEISLEDEAAILDTVKRKTNNNGTMETEMENTAMLKFLRLSLNGKSDDSFIRSLSLDEKVEMFNIFWDRVLTGEGTASSSK